MNVTTLNTAERIAAAICWLARQPGLPDVPALRSAVVERHDVACDWCDFPLDKLAHLCALEGSPDFEIFKRFPASTQRKLVEKALHAEVPA